MKFTHDQDGTHYVLWRLTTGMLADGGSHIWCVETGWGSNGLKEGDKPGLIALFKKAGLEVFG
jgi:hypothetical protein